MALCKPRTFECDTTFGTQSQGYKLHVQCYHSNHTDMWEVAGLLFLSSETEEKVRTGVNFFKSSLPYRESQVGKFFFFCDKDFQYINVLEELFDCIVFLCSIHVFRYFKDKVFNGKAFWEGGEEPIPLSPDEKGQVLQQIKLIRDSPSEELFNENQEKLRAMTEGLTVRPGNSKNAVQFCSYYETNWERCTFRRVWAFRKNLPTKGTNYTQAAESTFRAIKHYAKVEFGAVTPTMEQIITILPKILDQRSKDRGNKSLFRRMVIHNENPIYKLVRQVGI